MCAKENDVRDAVPVARQLETGDAFADLSFWRKLSVSGSDAKGWLNSLVSAELTDLADGGAVRSLLLSATGRVRAEFTVAATADEMLLLQDPIQPRSVERLLSPFVLSSDVHLQDRTAELCLFSLPGVHEPPRIPRTTAVSPSCLGSGIDLIAAAGIRGEVAAALAARFRSAGNEDVEIWRVMAAQPRVGVDVTEEDLPQEVRLDGAVAVDKGCYLGQEAVAKVRNLGHPRRVLVALFGEGPVSPGDEVHVGGRAVGEVTSAVRVGTRSFLLARVGWGARMGPFSTALGASLEPRPA